MKNEIVKSKNLFLIFIFCHFLSACDFKTEAQQMTESAVEDYIKSHASNPTTYNPINYNRFETSLSNDKSIDTYLILHKYTLLNNMGKIDTNEHRFEFDKNYNLLRIQTKPDENGTLLRITKDWINTYAKN